MSAENLPDGPNCASLQTLYIKAIMELCHYCPSVLGENEFALLRDHLTTYAENLQVTSTSDLMESLCCVCSHQADPLVLQQSFNNIAQIPVDFLNSIQSGDAAQVDRQHLVRAIAMVRGALKATIHLSDELLL